MQTNPLLEQLDWFFTSPNWTLDHPHTEVLPLAKITSDHIPCKIAIDTRIPTSNIFRFENYWAEHSDFLTQVQSNWLNSLDGNAVKNISSKFKTLRSHLKAWSTNLSNLNLLIQNCNTVILFLDSLKNRRTLFFAEANLRIIIKRQL
jgi:hypothetical protein